MRSKLSKDAIKKTLDRYNFFDSNWNKSGNFKNDFVDNNDGTVADRRTGLVWQKYGSYNCMKYDETSTYLDKLNREKFAGHDDWRLPTIGELASLLQNKQKADLYIDSVFSETQARCWSADHRLPDSAWGVSFASGYVYWLNIHDTCYVRCCFIDENTIY